MPDSATPALSAIILAAGRSARLGRPKQLLDLGGQPVIAHVVDHALAAGLDEIVLVLGHEADAIQTALGPRANRLRVFLNPDYAAGQSTSLRAGLTAVGPGIAGALVLLGDQPEVGPDVIAALAVAFRAATSPPPLVLPAYGPERVIGNPVVLGRALFPEVLAVTGDQGARDVVRAHRSEAVVVPFPDHNPPRDIDTEADYAALLAAWPSGRRGAPGG
jgi:molybdenum cofactor cytidylyltransferase